MKREFTSTLELSLRVEIRKFKPGLEFELDI
jgi:hypothetical protein